jgi:hypothetical protein
MKVAFSIVVLIIVGGFVLAESASAQYQWRRSTEGAFQGIAFNPRSNGETIFAASYDSIGIFRSDDHGLSWARYFDGLEPFATSDIRQILCVPTDTNIVLAVSPRTVYRSTNGGRVWTEVPNLGGIEGEDIDYQEVTDALYYGQNFRGPTWKSIDHGATWVVTGQATDSVGLCTIAVSPDLPTVLLAGSEGGEIARSTQEGMNWAIQMENDPGGPFEPEVPKIVYSKRAVNSSGVRGIAVCTRWPSIGNAIVKTIDNGVTWSSLHHISKNTWALEIDQRANAIASPADAAYPGPLHFWTGLFHDRSDTVRNGLVQETTDGGITWNSVGFPVGVDGDPINPITRDVWVMKFDTTSGRLIASTSTGVWIAETKLAVRQPAIGASNFLIQDNDGVSALEPSHLTLYDMLGRRLAVQIGTHLDLRSQPHGLYFVTAARGDRTASLQILW